MTIEREKQSLQSSSDGMDLEIDSEEDETLTEKLEAKFLRKILRRRLQTRTSPYSVTAPVQYQRYGYCL
jgi:predicted AAA+ superfamily ATPase